MTTIDIRLNGRNGPYFTRVLSPTPALPHWHEENGARVHFTALMVAGQAPAELAAAHGTAISQIVQAAIATTDHAERRRLALAAGRLAEEVTGLWTS